MLPVQMQLVKPGSQVRAGKDELTLSSGCPGDGIGRASGDQLTEAWTDDGISRWISAGRRCQSRRDSGEARDQCSSSKAHAEKLGR
jgi:hypothetical protein